MIAVLALATALLAQDTTGLSPLAQAMLPSLPLPRPGEVSVVTRFNTDRAWVGQQVELVTAAWFPRDLRERLRRQPTLRGPTLSGLWNAPGNTAPTLAVTRMIGGQVYDLFVAHQTLFPLGAGTTVAPPAVLSFSVPSSRSFFAPEERRSLESKPTSLRVLPIPERLVAALGDGPTASGLSIRWRLPDGVGHAGTPFGVELVVSGAGNVALWPAPRIEWPAGVRVYDEPVQTTSYRHRGIVSGDKRFRFTLIADSVGVLQLPAVTYPWFDPGRVTVADARAAAADVVVQPALPAVDRPTIAALTSLEIPLASRVVASGWPILALIALLPLVVTAWRRRRRRAVAHYQERRRDRLEELRRLLGPSSAETPAAVELALRRRGVTVGDAREVRDWLAAVSRHRWGRDPAMPSGGAAVDQVLRRLERSTSRKALLPLMLLLLIVPGVLAAQWQQGLERYRGGDAAGAARYFSQQLRLTPEATGAWLNLGAARFLDGDDVGSAAAWLQGLERAPRNRRLRAALASIPQLPRTINRNIPLVPLSRAELALLTLAAWLATALLWRRARRTALTFLIVTLVAAAMFAGRTWTMNRALALARSGTTLRISPVISAPVGTTVQRWTTVTIERSQLGWKLVRTPSGERGWVDSGRLASLSRID